MAFRGYELNLMLRVQDRASARLRRLSHDIGGISRAAELQRKANRLSLDQGRASVAITNTLAERESLLNDIGTKRLQNESQLLRAKARELTLQQRIGRMSQAALSSPVGQARLMQLRATQKDIVRLEESRRLAIRANNMALADQLLLEEQIKREAEQIALAQVRAEKLAIAQRRARTATHVGSAAIIAGGIGLAASAATASTFAEFNRQAVGAATQMRGVNESFASTVAISKVLQTTLLDLTRSFPASATEMADSIYDIASGMNFQINRTSRLTETQQRYNKSLSLLRRANQVAIAGNVDLATATDVLITTFNNFNPAADRQIQILDQLFAIVRFGKGTFAEFSPQIGRMAAAANAAGQSLLEAGGALAFLSQRLPLPQATTALTRIFQIIGRKEFTTGFEQLFKVSPFKEGTRQLRDLSELMFIIEKQGPRIWKGFTKGGVDLMNVLQNITAAGQNAMRGTTDAVGLISTQFARQAITNLLVFGKEYRNVLKDVSSTQGEFMKSLQAFRSQPGVRWQIAINQFKAFAIVVGQVVLPPILRFIQTLSNLARKFEDLSPHTKRLIGQFAAWGSIIVFVGGIVTTLIGGLAILVISLRALSTTTGGETGGGLLGRMTSLYNVMRGLAAIGAISLILRTAWTGDASAIDFIKGAMLGAAAGSIFGPQGAVLGALIVPVVMRIITHFRKPDEVIPPVQQAYQDFLDRTGANFRWFWEADPKSFEDFKKEFEANIATFKIPNAIDAIERNRNSLAQLRRTNSDTTYNVMKDWQSLATQLTGLDVFGGLNQSAATAAANVQLNLAKALAGKDTKAQLDALGKSIKFDQEQIARLEKIPKGRRTAEDVKNLTELYQDIATLQGKIDAIQSAQVRAQEKVTRETEKQRREAERHQRAIERANKALDTANRRVESLRLKFQQIREQTLDKLRSAFGEVFGGPFLQGPIGQVFTNISDTLAGFGQTFAIPAQFILQDQRLQQQNFERLTEDLSFLSKRGVDAKTIQNILGQGAGALPFLEGIRKGTPAQQKEFIQNLRERGQALTEALQSPWQKQITASNTQLKAAQLQLQAAQARVKETKGQVAEAKKPIKPSQTRTTQSVTHVTHGDQVTIHADGATSNAVKKALDRHSFDKRHRR